jgi:hypothetical protein
VTLAIVIAIPAHAGHWAAGLIYAAPVFILAGVLLLDWYKHRSEEDDEGEAGEAET